METILGMNFFVFCILVLIIVLYFSKEIRDEGFFGTSPGTMDQLASTHVPVVKEPTKIIDINRKPDQEVEDQIQANLTAKALMDMTGPGSTEHQYATASL
jgi:hypothetical protein